MYFTAVFLNENGNLLKKPTAADSCNVFVDGGILANYPIWMFDDGAFMPLDSMATNTNFNNKTIGLKVERPEQLETFATPGKIAPFTIVGFRQYISSLYNIVHENLNRRNSFETEMPRTVYISSGNISSRVRKITKAEKQQLYDNGFQAASSFIEKKLR
jgi:NTE family protein